MRIKLTNDFHRTEAFLNVKDFTATVRQVSSAKKKLCPVYGCQCSGRLGTRGIQEVFIGPNIDGTFYFRLKK